MTSNAINYAKVVEEGRHNVASEAETRRHNESVEQWNRDTLAETARHNAASESNELFRNLETQRHNIATEGENVRHNVQQETLGFQQLGETTRHNKASETIEQNRIGLGYAQLAETARHNTATESETHRANVAGEVLHGADTAVNVGNAATRVAENNERIRHNMVMEEQGWFKLNDATQPTVVVDQSSDLIQNSGSGQTYQRDRGLGFSLLTPFGQLQLGTYDSKGTSRTTN